MVCQSASQPASQSRRIITSISATASTRECVEWYGRTALCLSRALVSDNPVAGSCISVLPYMFLAVCPLCSAHGHRFCLCRAEALYNQSCSHAAMQSDRSKWDRRPQDADMDGWTDGWMDEYKVLVGSGWGDWIGTDAYPKMGVLSYSYTAFTHPPQQTPDTRMSW
jgi:hypothetical protein